MTIRRPLASQRAEYLESLGPVLWPGSEARLERGRARGGEQHDREYLVVPHARAPRLLLPMHPRRSAASAVLHYSEAGSLAARLRFAAAALAVRSGVAGLVLRDRLRIAPSGGADGSARVGDIEDYLRSQLGDVVLSIQVRPQRANRKPVLQVLDSRGRTLGFVKVGINELTQQLVRNEASALRHLATSPLSTVVVPSVIHQATWNGHELLVQSALPVWRPRGRPDSSMLAEAMLEVVLGGSSYLGPLARSRYARQLSARVAALPENGTGAVVRELWSQVSNRAGGAVLRFGGGHGDWSPWNMAVLADHVLVWDWERFAPEVPAGFDALHYALQRSVGRHGVPPADAVQQTLSTAPSVLGPFGHDSSTSMIVSLLYLVDLSVRYAADSHDAVAARTGVLQQWLDEWLLPTVSAGVGRL